MGLMDKVKDMLGKHDTQAKQGVDKAGDAVDAKTDGKYASQVDTGQEKANDFIDKADEA